jgi:UDP-N-acetylmuramoylalanine--D-glutamate ligase
VVTFSASGSADVSVAGDAIVSPKGAIALDGIRIRGRHNLSNACAAVAVAQALGATNDGIRRALSSFAGLPHRHALVGELAGVRFYNDSKATNVGAAVAALEGLEEDMAVLIAGGRDKLGDYAPLVAALGTRGRVLVVLGEAAERIAAAAEGVLPIERATSLEDAVLRATRVAQPGDAVLLSPACSSYDMFKSYTARGDAFAAAVQAIIKERS